MWPLHSTQPLLCPLNRKSAENSVMTQVPSRVSVPADAQLQMFTCMRGEKNGGLMSWFPSRGLPDLTHCNTQQPGPCP